MIFTADQIATFARNAGFTGPDLLTAIAVCNGESSFNPDEYNPETEWFARNKIAPIAGGGSTGLWQIFVYYHMKDFPEWKGWNFRDPQVNACAASILQRRYGWSQWASYSFNSPGYQRGLAIAQNWQGSQGSEES